MRVVAAVLTLLSVAVAGVAQSLPSSQDPEFSPVRKLIREAMVEAVEPSVAVALHEADAFYGKPRWFCYRAARDSRNCAGKDSRDSRGSTR